jgi:hypothetical protein
MTLVNGQLQTSSVLREYMDRGSLLDGYCLLDFVRNTYDGTKLAARQSENTANLSQASIRSDYRSDNGEGSKCRVLRQKGHDTIVEFVGSWIPRNDNMESRGMYCAVMLALLVPWRNLACIHGSSSSIEAEFDRFQSGADDKQSAFMHNVQYYHECFDSALRKRREGSSAAQQHLVEVEDMIFDDQNDYEGSDPDFEEPQITEEQIEDAICNRFSDADQLFAATAMNIAEDKGIFRSVETNISNDVVRQKFGHYATLEVVLPQLKPMFLLKN